VRILIFFFFFISLFAKPLPIDEVFVSKFTPKKDGVEFNIKIAPKVHIYKKSIKILVENKDFKIVFPKSKKDDFGEEIYENNFKIFIPTKKEIKITYQGCSDEMVCYAPKTDVYTPKLDTPNKTNNDDEFTILFNKSIWIILGSFFVFGLLLSLTPCIFPMIPILSGLIVKAGSKGKITPFRGFFISLVYVLSMSITYTIAGVLAGLFGKNIQALFQNPYIILSFSGVFILLALSMFGFFEIGLPSSLQTKLTQKSDKAGQSGGLIGVGIMGFLSALIVGPCVAPPLAGALIYIGQSGDALLGGSALFVMSLGMGVPLFIIGLGAGKFMPKAGSWMIGVNRVFGVIMLGVSIFMASRVLDEMVISILWGILGIGSGLYLNPFSKMENYKEVIFKTLGFLLILLGSIMIFKVFNPSNDISKLNWQITKTLNNLEGDVIVDFTAKWCVACKEYEETTFKDKKVINVLKNYKLLKIDVTQNSKKDIALMKKFSIVGPPAILVFEDGKLVKKIIGYKNPKEFLKLLNN